MDVECQHKPYYTSFYYNMHYHILETKQCHKEFNKIKMYWKYFYLSDFGFDGGWLSSISLGSGGHPLNEHDEPNIVFFI